MSHTVLLSNIVEALDGQGDENSAYLDKNNGEAIILMSDDFRAIEDDVSLDNYSPWERENIQMAKKILHDCHKTSLALPTKFEVNEYRIMEQFCFSREDEEVCDTLCNVIRGRGAFRMFKDCIYRLEIAGDWYQYRSERLKEIAINWCRVNDIIYEDDLNDPAKGKS